MTALTLETQPRVQIDPERSTATKAETALADVSRNEGTDVVRFFAAAGIVFVHATHEEVFRNWSNFARFAVPFFLFAGFYYQSLSLLRRADRPLTEHLLHKARRIYLPFLAWSVIYLAGRDVKRHFLEHKALVELQPSMLWKGTEYHLWFLPFMLLCLTLLALVHRPLQRNAKVFRWPAIVTAFSLGCFFAIWPMPNFGEVFDNPTYAYFWWWRALPSTFWAMAFTWYMTLGPRIYRVPRSAGIFGIMLAISTVGMQMFEGIRQFPRALSGFGCMLAALAPWRGLVVSVLARFGRLGYGIYLCHVLIVESIQAVVHKLGVPLSVPMDLATFAVGFPAAIALTSLLARSRYTAWLNG